MDPFDSEFDVENALTNEDIHYEALLSSPSSSTTTINQQLESINQFERFLCETNPHLCERLIEIDHEAVQRSAHKLSLPSGKRREERLAALCARRDELQQLENEKDNKEASTSASFQHKTIPIQLKLHSRNFNQRLYDRTSVAYHKSNNMFSGPLERLYEWVNERKRVRITLRSLSRVSSVITAVIVAFDKHWNMIIRDGDDKFLPSVRQQHQIFCGTDWLRPYNYKRVQPADSDQTNSTDGKFSDEFGNMATLASEKYPERRRCLLERHLKCSFIRGDNVVLISALC
ncbi:unnamed protein product [Anisakis simplex]|uniref:Sm domain-containing protein n=1 Tax=Anisakis simplex TaxID=6269 RepID=A0A0M3JSA3_ANISI|nr:unnamed protein product [Anisakis simplex]